MEQDSTPRLLRLVRRPLGSVGEGLTPGKKRFGTTQRDLRESENEKLKGEVVEVRRKMMEMQQKYEDEIQRLLAHIKDLKDRSNFTEPIASIVRSSISSFTSLHKELQLELGDFHAKTVRRIRGREADIFNVFAARVKQLETDLTAEREKHKDRCFSKDDPWTVVKRLEATVRESEEFHSLLLADNKALKEKCKEYQTNNEVRSIENERIMQENAKLKRQIDASKPGLPASTRDTGTQDSLDLPDTNSGLICVIDALKSKLSTVQKDLRNTSQDLARECARHTELEGLLARCIEDIRSQAQSMETYSGRLRGVLTQKERQQLVQRLMLEQQMLEILKVNAFPVGTLRAYLNEGSPMNGAVVATGGQSCRSRSVVRLPK